MLTKLFFSETPGVRLDRVYREGSVVHLIAVAIRRAAKCPLCHRRSKRVHSRYERTVTDLPCAGDIVSIHLSTRRFVCRVRWFAGRSSQSASRLWWRRSRARRRASGLNSSEADLR